MYNGKCEYVIYTCENCLARKIKKKQCNYFKSIIYFSTLYNALAMENE